MIVWIRKGRRMRISFHGADLGVTGSCHMLECGGKRILVDCGLYQGGWELAEENAEPFGFDPAEIDCVLLTHAHLDHCGRLPLLVKRGFRGEIVTTAATRELARLVMLDAAHLQDEEHRRSGDPPLYSIIDAFYVIDFFGRTASYGKPLQLSSGIKVTFLDAGHILGSASILVESEGRSVLFSGDIGNEGRPILRSPATPAKADFVVMETTYGDRLHRPFEPSVEEFYRVIEQTFGLGGNVIVPTFALERAQELLYFLREGVEKGRLSRSLQVFLDSPMAISATQIFEKHPECFGQRTAEMFGKGGDPFHLQGLHFTRETSESIAINRISGGAVIMAGSGMCTGGRIRHHLLNSLDRDNCSVVFVGFAAKGTLARKIIDGAKEVRVLGREVPVRARIETINGFSAHADQAELLAWHGRIGGNPATFLVHGEEGSMTSFASLLKGCRVEMPSKNQAFDL